MLKIPNGSEIKSYTDIQKIVSHVVDTCPKTFSEDDITAKVQALCSSCPIELDNTAIKKIIAATLRTGVACGKLEHKTDGTYAVK